MDKKSNIGLKVSYSYPASDSKLRTKMIKVNKRLVLVGHLLIT